MKVFPMALDHFIERELLYADDTLILGHRAREVNIFLDLIVAESKRYNLKLKKGRCKHIDMNCKPNVDFADGEQMEHSQKEKYLGGVRPKDVSRQAELANRLGAAMATAQKLNNFWRHQKVPHKMENTGVQCGGDITTSVWTKHGVRYRILKKQN